MLRSLKALVPLGRQEARRLEAWPRAQPRLARLSPLLVVLPLANLQQLPLLASLQQLLLLVKLVLTSESLLFRQHRHLPLALQRSENLLSRGLLVSHFKAVQLLDNLHGQRQHLVNLPSRCQRLVNPLLPRRLVNHLLHKRLERLLLLKLRRKRVLSELRSRRSDSLLSNPQLLASLRNQARSASHLKAARIKPLLLLASPPQL